VYNNTPGFQRIDILSIRSGSVICEYDVILLTTSTVDGNKLRQTVLKASEDGQLEAFGKVTSVEVKDEKKETTKEVLPSWALVTLILLGVIVLILLITIIVLGVS